MSPTRCSASLPSASCSSTTATRTWWAPSTPAGMPCRCATPTGSPPCSGACRCRVLPTPPEGLRHWRADDAPALETAWADPEITRWNRPPEGLDAGTWIAGVEQRWARRLALDLAIERSEEHTSELPSLLRLTYAVFCLTKKQ